MQFNTVSLTSCHISLCPANAVWAIGKSKRKAFRKPDEMGYFTVKIDASR
jgi:hypothetical protein